PTVAVHALSLHAALPIFGAMDRLVVAEVLEQFLLDRLHLPHAVIEAGTFRARHRDEEGAAVFGWRQFGRHFAQQQSAQANAADRSEEHTSELQSREKLVC